MIAGLRAPAPPDQHGHPPSPLWWLWWGGGQEEAPDGHFPLYCRENGPGEAPDGLWEPPPPPPCGVDGGRLSAARRPPCGVDDVLPRSVDTRISENHDSTRENGRREAHEAHLFRMSHTKRQF